jgi:hypothetical protein
MTTNDERLRRLEEAHAAYLEALRERNAAAAEVKRLTNAGPPDDETELDAELREIWRNR